MKAKSLIVRLLLLLLALLITESASATPVRCSYGYQDSTCLPTLSYAPQPPPQCPTSVGWTTVAAAVWIGSQFSAPQCSYQAPPACPPGNTQGGPTWDGSEWVNLICTPFSEPSVPTLPNSVQACWASQNVVQGSINATFTGDSENDLTYYNVTGEPAVAVGYGTVSNFNAASEYQAMLLADTGISGGGCDHTIQESGGAPPGGQISVISILWRSAATASMCYLQAGTTNVLGTSSWACSAGHG
jgi:hypothetical protein